MLDVGPSTRAQPVAGSVVAQYRRTQITHEASRVGLSRRIRMVEPFVRMRSRDPGAGDPWGRWLWHDACTRSTQTGHHVPHVPLLDGEQGARS